MATPKPVSSEPALLRKNVKSEDKSELRRETEYERQAMMRRLAAAQARRQSDQL